MSKRNPTKDELEDGWREQQHRLREWDRLGGKEPIGPPPDTYPDYGPALMFGAIVLSAFIFVALVILSRQS